MISKTDLLITYFWTLTLIQVTVKLVLCNSNFFYQLILWIVIPLPNALKRKHTDFLIPLSHLSWGYNLRWTLVGQFIQWPPGAGLLKQSSACHGVNWKRKQRLEKSEKTSSCPMCPGHNKAHVSFFHNLVSVIYQPSSLKPLAQFELNAGMVFVVPL